MAASLIQVGVDGAVLGSDGDGGAEGLAGGVGVLADGLDVGAGVGLDALEDEALALEGVLHAGLAQVVEDDGDEVGGVAGRRGFAGRPVRAAPVAAGQHPMRRKALDRERPGHADARRVLVGLVVEQLGVGVTADGGVDLLARHALVDVGVVGDRLQHDVRNAPVDEALADVVGVTRGGRRNCRSARPRACAPSGESASSVVREARAHKT